MATETYKHDGTDWQLITAIQYTDDTLTDRSLTEMWYNDDGTWLQVFDTIASNAVSLDDKNVTSTRDTASGSGTATSTYQLTSDGIAQQHNNINSSTDTTATTNLSGDNWWTGKPSVAIGDDYEVMATQTGTSGAGTFTGTLGAWTSLSTLQDWELVDTGNFVERISSRTLTIEIRDTATMTIQDTATVVVRTVLFGP